MRTKHSMCITYCYDQSPQSCFNKNMNHFELGEAEKVTQGRCTVIKVKGKVTQWRDDRRRV